MGLKKAIDTLPQKEKLVLSLYYQDELTMKEIGKVMDLTESRICQIHVQATLRLRSAIKDYR
jgi:RNA polymerase sigma factor FliA